MNNIAVRFIGLFVLYICIFVLVKPLFLLAYGIGYPISDWFDVIWHGLSMDMSMAGYLSVIPALLMIVGIWISEKPIKLMLKVYSGVIALVVATIIVLDVVLYGYWGFRLDSTPLFYFASSPKAAMASASIWQIVGGFMAIVVIASLIYYFSCFVICRYHRPENRKGLYTLALTLLMAALFIPIRGGVTVSTMNLSRVYYSNERLLNHAGVNPAFSLMYSLTHSGDFGSQYRFMSEDDKQAILAQLNAEVVVSDSISAKPLLNTERPDIYLIILESFNAHLMPSLGGDSVAIQLDSIGAKGLLYTNFYASSFRTDRALTAILNAFPAQPSTSVMKYVEKAEALPALAATLKDAGYNAAYYYGGDANFTNMKALLVNAGYDPIISDADFAIREKMSKWGAHDDVLFRRALSDVYSADVDGRSRFIVIQTSSSHEPFEVPYSNDRFVDNPQKNAFAFADSCLGEFVRSVEAGPRGDKALFVIVPDHLGAWPLDLESATERHHVPLVLAGPALARKGERDATPAGQPDIAPTILAALGIDASQFAFGHDLCNPALPHYAFFSEPGLAAFLDEKGNMAVIDCDANTTIEVAGDSAYAVSVTKAYLQNIYDTLSQL